MWSHRVTSDANAVLDALSRVNKDAEQTFRASRMDRLARETEIQKARERAEKAAEESDVVESTSGPSTPGVTKSSPTTVNGAPVFGAVSEKKGTKKAGKKAARDVSAEVQHKMANATAMSQAGMSKKYSWLTSVPNVSSPLAGGKKRKAGKEDGGGPGVAVPDGETSGSGDGDGREKGKQKGKDKEREQQPPNGVSPDREEEERPAKRSRAAAVLSSPTRRMVVVERNSKGEERRVQDDRVVTMMDLLFAMERDGLGKGMGTADEIVRRVWATGGNWKDSTDEGRGR